MKAWRTICWMAGVPLLLLLWAPLVVVIVYSFNAARFGSAWHGFTWEWYPALWRNEAALQAAWNSLRLALLSTAISTVLGTLLGRAWAGFSQAGRRRVGTILQIPVLVPDVVFAIGLLLWFSVLRNFLPFPDAGLITMAIGHIAFQIPFVAWVVQARADGLDPALDEAARDLGATPFQVLWHVSLPLLRPGIVAGALLALTLSLDDFAVSFFTSGPGTATLPVYIYGSARRGITPDLNALSTLLILLTLIAVVALRGVRRSGAPP